MAKAARTKKTPSDRSGGLKAAVENHPILVTVSVVSILINAVVGATQAYGTLFGEKPLLDTEYVDTSIDLAEYSEPEPGGAPRRTGLVRPYGCRIAQNDLQRGYLATQSDRPSSRFPLGYSDGSIASVEDRVLYLVIRNVSGFSRDVRVFGSRMRRPYDLSPGSGSSQRLAATLDGLVGSFDYQLRDDAPEPVEVPLGSLRANECVAIPVAVYKASPNDEGAQLVSAPVYRFEKLQYRRSFGWTDESQAIRPPNTIPLTITPVTGGRG